MPETNENTTMQMDMMKDANIGHVQPAELGGEMRQDFLAYA